jgi:hypothetical protein
MNDFGLQPLDAVIVEPEPRSARQRIDEAIGALVGVHDLLARPSPRRWRHRRVVLAAALKGIAGAHRDLVDVLGLLGPEVSRRANGEIPYALWQTLAGAGAELQGALAEAALLTIRQDSPALARRLVAALQRATEEVRP